MMTDSLSPLTRKIVALGLVVIAVLGALNLFILPVTDLHAAREGEIARARRQIAAYRQVLARAPALKTRIERIKADPGRRRGLLAAANPVLAGAQLENMLKTIVQANGGTLRSTRMQPQAGDGPERVQVTLDFTADAAALLTIIRKIETAVPWLTTDNVQIRTAPIRQERTVPISARMDVSAFVWRDGQ